MAHGIHLLAAALAASLVTMPATADLVPAIEPVVPTGEDALEPFVPVSEELAEALKSDGFLEPIVKPFQKPLPIWCDLARKRKLEDGTIEYVAGPGRVFPASSSASRVLPDGMRLPGAARFPVPAAGGDRSDLFLAQDEMEVTDPALSDPALAVEQDVCVECADAAFDAGELPLEKWQILGDEFEVLPEEEGLPLAGLPILVAGDGGGGGVPFPVLGAIGGGGGFVPIVPVVTWGGGPPGGRPPGGGTPPTPPGGGPGITPPPAPIPLPQTGALILLALGALGAARRSGRRS